MKKIVMFIGGVETLEYFSIQMGNEFKTMGYSVFYYDLKDEETSAKKVRKFIKPGETVLITFNFEGLEKEPGVYKEGIGYIWESYGIPCYNIAADHPYYYDDRLKDLPKDYHHISIDKLQEKYFREFYPEFIDEGFLPLAGTKLVPQELNLKEDSSQRIEIVSEKEVDNRTDKQDNRIINVIMTGNYTIPSFCDTYIHWINDEYAAFYQGIIDDIIAHPHRTVEEVALEHCEREMGENTYQDLRLAMHRMIFIDLYVRNYWRGEVIKTLVDAGIKVDVFGKGWDELVCSHPENLILHEQTTSLDCLQQISNAKISVNVMPWFKDGAHDRVFNSILNGAVCVSDKSKYLCEELQEGQGVTYFDLEHLEELPPKVECLLANETLRNDMLKKGIPIVTENHTWKKRAHQLDNILHF